MSNTRIEKLIATKLREGMIHPGDPDNDIPPVPIQLPFATKAGMPEEMSKLMDGTVKLLSEAIVHTIEVDGDSEILPKDEVRGMQRASGEGSGMEVVPVFCRCNRDVPLMMLTVPAVGPIVIDGGTLMNALNTREVTCPHKVIG